MLDQQRGRGWPTNQQISYCACIVWYACASDNRKSLKPKRLSLISHWKRTSQSLGWHVPAPDCSECQGTEYRRRSEGSQFTWICNRLNMCYSRYMRCLRGCRATESRQRREDSANGTAAKRARLDPKPEPAPAPAVPPPHHVFQQNGALVSILPAVAQAARPCACRSSLLDILARGKKCMWHRNAASAMYCL